MLINKFQGEHDYLSNFYHAPFTFLGYDLNTVENGYQAFKTLNLEERKSIIAGSPGHAKRLGRRATLRPDFDEMKLGLMYQLVLAKFTQNLRLAEKLVMTGDAVIQEGNHWHDQFWGVSIQTGQGQNHLGKILMDVRLELHAVSSMRSGAI